MKNARFRLLDMGILIVILLLSSILFRDFLFRSSDDDWLIDLVMNEDQSGFSIRDYAFTTQKQDVLDDLEKSERGYTEEKLDIPDPDLFPIDVIQMLEPVEIGFEDLTAEMSYHFLNDWPPRPLVRVIYTITLPASETNQFDSLVESTIDQIQFMADKNGIELLDLSDDTHWVLEDDSLNHVRVGLDRPIRCYIHILSDSEKSTEDHILQIYTSIRLRFE